MEKGKCANILLYPPIAQNGFENHRDSSKDKYLLFLHGYNVTASEAAAWSSDLFKRIYWLGYRKNFIGITWQGDKGWPDTFDQFKFFDDVENALETAPSLYRFIRNTMEASSASGGWGVPAGDINVMAHSLGNLVMWDALRISANYDPGTPLINNAISVEAAVWPEAFAPQEPEVYSADDDPETYPTLTGGAKALINHSWKFWFQQDGALANGAAAGVYHSYVPGDGSLWWMREGDFFTNSDHYHRENLELSPPAPRRDNNFGDVPTLIQHEGHRRISAIPPRAITPGDLNLPVGTQDNPIAGLGNHEATELDDGWRTAKHSDLRERPIYSIYNWYDIFLRDGIECP